jgi:DNA-binding MarR family transcriptional regulator
MAKQEGAMARDPERLMRAVRPPAEHFDVRGTAAFGVTLAYRALRWHLGPDRWDHGLTEGQDLVLLEIGRLGGSATASRLQEALVLRANGVSSALGFARRVDYVRRVRDSRDGRVWRLELTDRGRSAAVSAGWLWREADGVLRTSMSEADLLWLRHLVSRAKTAWGSPDAAGDVDSAAGA